MRTILLHSFWRVVLIAAAVGGFAPAARTARSDTMFDQPVIRRFSLSSNVWAHGLEPASCSFRYNTDLPNMVHGCRSVLTGSVTKDADCHVLVLMETPGKLRRFESPFGVQEQSPRHIRLISDAPSSFLRMPEMKGGAFLYDALVTVIVSTRRKSAEARVQLDDLTVIGRYPPGPQAETASDSSYSSESAPAQSPSVIWSAPIGTARWNATAIKPGLTQSQSGDVLTVDFGGVNADSSVAGQPLNGSLRLALRVPFKLDTQKDVVGFKTTVTYTLVKPVNAALRVSLEAGGAPATTKDLPDTSAVGQPATPVTSTIVAASDKLAPASAGIYQANLTFALKRKKGNELVVIVVKSVKVEPVLK